MKTSGHKPASRPKKPRREKKPTFSKLVRFDRHQFTDFQGKVLERVDVMMDIDEEHYIELRFEDQTALLFIIQQRNAVTVTPDYVHWKNGNWRRIHGWPPLF
jgi:hypothetical protein